MKSTWGNLDTNFGLATRALERSNIPYYVGHGSLLGLVRDRALIPWDNDIDLCIPGGSASIEQIEKSLASVGFALVKRRDNSFHFARGTGRTVDINLYKQVERLNEKGEPYPAQVITWTIEKPRSPVKLAYSLISACIEALDRGTSSYNLPRRLNLSVFLLSPEKSKRLLLRTRDFLESRREFFDVEYVVPESLMDFEEATDGKTSWVQPKHRGLILETLYGPPWLVQEKSRICWNYSRKVAT